MITKNTDPYKLKKCVTCKKDIALNERYFAYPLSLQQMCLGCAEKEIPKTIEALQKDMEKIKQAKNSTTKTTTTGD
ncbi:MAG TPA: hypothetical protein VHA09_07240 [Nitrososphaera sp.]|nr:hypothetical protein [Nitrososphaera sp.]